MEIPVSKAMVSVKVSEHVRDKIDALANLIDCSPDDVLDRTLEEFVDEKYRLYKEIDEAVKEADASNEWISHEKMSAWIDSLGTENELPPPEPDIFINRT
jgi:predicted transcriptional regulator